MKSLAKKELVIGVSVIAAIIVLVFGIDYLKGINLFNPANFYYVEYENVSGLDISAPVSINGYKVGQVRQIDYDYEHPGKIKVLLAVNDKLKIPEGSRAEMANTLMNGAYINITLGTSDKMIPVGGVIDSKGAKGLMDALGEDIMPAVNSILPRVDSLLANLNVLVTDPAIAMSIHRLDGITSDVRNITTGLDHTIAKDVPLVMRNAGAITNKIDSVSINLIALSNSLRQLPIASTMDNVNAITVNLEQFSQKLNSSASSIGRLNNDPELYNRLNRVSADLDSLIVDIKKNPKRYISIKLL